MNYNLLNEMSKYIEKNLTERIDYKKLAKIVGISEYNLQRVFVYLTGISISEYIRQRRLSKAYEELKTTNVKIIDLAIKYNYESSTSFSRAFKKCYNMTPIECRKKVKEYQVFPIIEFENNMISDKISYEVIEMQTKELYCYGVSAILHEDLLFKIRNLYKRAEKNLNFSKGSNKITYGIYVNENNKYKYYIASEQRFQYSKRITIEKGKYVVIKVGNREQRNILKVYDLFYKRWLNSINYQISDKPEIELYENNNCYIYFPVKDK